jgi:chromosome partitioning protein
MDCRIGRRTYRQACAHSNGRWDDCHGRKPQGGCWENHHRLSSRRFFQSLAPTLLLDGDETRNATAWSKRGEGVSFKIADEVQAAKLARDFIHIVIDTGQRPKQVDLKALAEGCDLLIIPTVPATLDTEGLVLTIEALTAIGAHSYMVLLTKVPPAPEMEGPQLRRELTGQGIPLFAAEIPRLKAFEKAAAQGVPVSLVDDPRAKRAWDAYQAVGVETLSHA